MNTSRRRRTTKLPTVKDKISQKQPAKGARFTRTAVARINGIAPRIVDEGISLIEADYVAENVLSITYAFVSLRISAIDTEIWEKQVLPKIVQNVRRAGMEEACNLYSSEITVRYLYLDCEKRFIMEVAVEPRHLPCAFEEPQNN